MKKSVIVVLVSISFIIILPLTQNSDSLTPCLHMKSIESAFENADVVFLGKVVEENYGNLDYPTTSEPEISTIEFQVMESFKGFSNKTITLIEDYYSLALGNTYTKGYEYLVFAVEREYGFGQLICLQDIEPNTENIEKLRLLATKEKYDIDSKKFIPQIKIFPSNKLILGKSYTIHVWLSTYEGKSDDLRFYVDILDPNGNQIDSTLWFAREDFRYDFDTKHLAYNITKPGSYQIKIEKADNITRTGEIVNKLEFLILKTSIHKPISPLKQVHLHGVLPFDVICSGNLVLIFKSTDSSPACVAPKTAEKLLQRGWGKHHKQEEKIENLDNPAFDASKTDWPSECGSIFKIVYNNTTKFNPVKIKESIANIAPELIERLHGAHGNWWDFTRISEPDENGLAVIEVPGTFSSHDENPNYQLLVESLMELDGVSEIKPGRSWCF